MERVESMQNPMIQRLRSLKKAQSRQEEGLFLVEGEKMMREAAEHLRPFCALFSDEYPGDLPDALRLAGAIVLSVPRRILEAVCDTKTPQGACAAFSLPEPLNLKNAPDYIVALDGVQDPGNVGTILRTADAAGFQALVLGPGCADPLSPKVQRAAMGSGFRIPFAKTGDLPATLDRLIASGHAVVASALTGAPFYESRPPRGAFILVIGSEAHGVSAPVLDRATLTLKLPMRGGAQSLNAAVAAGIMMYELLKELPG